MGNSGSSTGGNGARQAQKNNGSKPRQQAGSAPVVHPPQNNHQHAPPAPATATATAKHANPATRERKAFKELVRVVMHCIWVSASVKEEGVKRRGRSHCVRSLLLVDHGRAARCERVLRY